MEQTLLLNASYEPLKIVHWQKAITLLCQGKVEVISVYDREIRAVSISFKLPSVIRLLRYIKIKRRFDYVPFSRANIYARDDRSDLHRAGISDAEHIGAISVVRQMRLTTNLREVYSRGSLTPQQSSGKISRRLRGAYTNRPWNRRCC